MNLRVLAYAAATLAGSAALASACGAPDLVVPPTVVNDGSVPGPGSCSDAASMAIRANTGAQPGTAVLIDCQGKVVAYDPSEGLCDARLGYLVCNGGCFSEFVCEIPDGYTIVQLDGGPVMDSAAAKGVDAASDAVSDDARVDALSVADAALDATLGDVNSGDAGADSTPGDAGSDVELDSPSDAVTSDTTEDALADAPAE